MSYLVLARKYRPQTFGDVVAQEHVTKTLRNALKNNRIASGYLFCGPRGTGKTTIARILARSVNCATGPTDEPCGSCPSCLEIASGSSLDVLEIDAASNTGVDDIRTLRENVRYLPTGGKKRIYIIDEVHRLSGSAFDALLKTLEEPPAHVMFIFATTEPLKVPETILSRTQRYDFRRVSLEDLAGHLRKVATAEGIAIDDAALHLLARKAEGSVRDALSLLDQIIAFSGTGVTESDVINALGLVDRKFLFDFVDAISAANRLEVLKLTQRLFDSGTDPRDFVVEFMDHLRTLLVLATDPEPGDLISVSLQERPLYQQQATKFSVGDLLRLLKLTSELYKDLGEGLDERLLIEVSAVKMAELESTVRLEEVLRHLQSGATLPSIPSTGSPQRTEPTPPKKGSDFFVGNNIGASRSVAPPTNPPDASVPSTMPKTSRPISLEEIKVGWEPYLTTLRQSSQMLASQVRLSELREVKENRVTLVFYGAAEMSRQLVQKAENLSLILRTMREHFGTNLTISFDLDRTRLHPEQVQDKKSTPAIDGRKLVEESPALQALMAKVDGEVIGVRRIE